MESEAPVLRKASFATQADALLRKNIAFQKRNVKANLQLIAYPILICVLLFGIQKLVDRQLDNPKFRCGCKCVDKNGDGTCEEVCGIEYSDLDQVFTCPIPSPLEWPALLQVPRPESRAARTDPKAFTDLQDASCRKSGTCPATVLLTGKNQDFAMGVAKHFFPSLPEIKNSNILDIVSKLLLGTDSVTSRLNFLEQAFYFDRPLYVLQPNCTLSKSSISELFKMLKDVFQMTNSMPIPDIEIKCVSGTYLWRNSSSIVNEELFNGYSQASGSSTINEIMTAYDLLNSNNGTYNVRIWYNSTYRVTYYASFESQVRVVRSVNLLSNAYLKHLKGSNMSVQLDFSKEMPKPQTRLQLDFSSLLGPIFFQWVVELIFPVLLTYLVYEKQHKLRIMMKMHGLGDGAYWIISYVYFLFISTIYVFFLVIFGSLIGLNFFTTNDYSLQFVFYFSFINLQIALAFTMSAIFSNVKTAQAVAYLYIFGTGILAAYLFRAFFEDLTFPRNWVQLMEIVPAFAIYRGLYEFGQYSFNAGYMGTSGMRWDNLHDIDNGMEEVLTIIIVEWLVLLLMSYLMDQLSSVRGRQMRYSLHSLRCLSRKVSQSPPTLFHEQESSVHVDVDRPDVREECVRVEDLICGRNASENAVLCHNLRKVYPGRDGNPEKLAVQNLSLALSSGECFGVLGPNGAGKTTFISMMVGLETPSSGEAFVKGHSIETDMDRIYASMGVCPQHDMIWQTLTGKEHLLFYGRLKNLKGDALTKAVEESLRSVNLFHGSIADKQAGKYSGGMKRRLSVAISLIGDPKVVYMDEPSTGLDPASRNDLWNAVKNAKKDRAIILTTFTRLIKKCATHSMEEAEVLCDRLGVFVNGKLQCIGNAKELKARYGGTYIFTITTSASEEQKAEALVRRLSANMKRIYHISGTQKFQIPKSDVKIGEVFRAVTEAKRRFDIKAWGISDTTLEDVFINVARAAGPVDQLS